MLLSLFLSHHVLTGALINEETREVQNIHTQRLEYRPSMLDPILTRRLLDDFVKEGFGSNFYIEDFKICLVRTHKDIIPSDLNLNMVMNLETMDLLPQYNLVPIILDTKSIKKLMGYENVPIKDYLNYIHYNVDFTPNMLLPLESITLNEALGGLVSNADFVFSDLYNTLSSNVQKKHMQSLFKDIVELNTKVRKVGMIFDHDFKYAALLAGLKYLNVDPKHYFKDKPMDPDVHIINLKGLKKFSYVKNGEDLSDKVIEGEINYFTLKREEDVELSSSVVKEKFSNSLGIVIDARNFGKNQ